MCWASAARHAALSSQTEQRAGLICCAVIPGGVSALSHRSSLASRTRFQQTLSPATQYNSCFSDLKQNINTYVSQSLLAIFLKLSLFLLFNFCANPNLLALSWLARTKQARLHKAGNITLQLCRISRLTPAGMTVPN